ncbi:hypothetical protein QTL95_01560 [Rhizobium sp. S152]|uniref:hypothetical protein n=1 Tax=Rhizobium sp. S152 TaxID=3055038 RepID=UPI0025AA1A20|nr:hypothetical protein [Rhizobium sp. S152]MDM9624564.1 hypothetical protein [Rhizobium sp. S152]
MSKEDIQEAARRKSMTDQKRREKFQAILRVAVAMIETEVEARRIKTERLRAARTAAARDKGGYSLFEDGHTILANKPPTTSGPVSIGNCDRLQH